MNTIRGIRKNFGEWASDNDEIIGAAVEYFVGMLTSVNPQSMDQALGGVYSPCDV